MSLNKFRKLLEQKKGQKFQLEKDISSVQKDNDGITIDIKDTTEARHIIQTVAQKIQQRLEYRLGKIVTLIFDTVFEESYKFKTVFDITGRGTECRLLFEKDGQLFDPMFSNGGGIIDIAAMALRITLWSLTQPKSRNTLILDEPMRFVSQEYQKEASLVLSELSKKMNLQIIMVSHSEVLISGADKIFKVEIENGVSRLTEIDPKSIENEKRQRKKGSKKCQRKS